MKPSALKISGATQLALAARLLPLGNAKNSDLPRNCKAEEWSHHGPQHFLYFLPEPQEQGSFLPCLGDSARGFKTERTLKS